MEKNQRFNIYQQINKEEFNQYITELKTTHFWTSILVVLYFVGFIGFKTPWCLYFAKLTPVLLSLSLFLVIKQSNNLLKTSLFSLVVFILGYAVEVYGVKTGIPFGIYQYGETLGFKKFDTPLIIGVNWALVTISANSLINHYFPNINLILRVVLSALIMVSLDILIEPVAMMYDMWNWQDNEIPFQNYLGWFGVSLFFSLIFQLVFKNTLNKIAASLFIIMFFFFFLVQIDFF